MTLGTILKETASARAMKSATHTCVACWVHACWGWPGNSSLVADRPYSRCSTAATNRHRQESHFTLFVNTLLQLPLSRLSHLASCLSPLASRLCCRQAARTRGHESQGEGEGEEGGLATRARLDRLLLRLLTVAWPCRRGDGGARSPTNPVLSSHSFYITHCTRKHSVHCTLGLFPHTHTHTAVPRPKPSPTPTPPLAQLLLGRVLHVEVEGVDLGLQSRVALLELLAHVG